MIQISLQDLMVFLLILVAIVVGIFLIMVLANTVKITKTAKDLLKANKDQLDQSIKNIAGTLDNVDIISGNVKDTTELVAGLKNSKPGAESYIRIAAELMQVIYNIVINRKKH